jgi:hypothetical protein
VIIRHVIIIGASIVGSTSMDPSPVTDVSTTRTVPKHILNHPGFISAVRADSTGYYEQNKESVYTTMLAMCGTQEMLQTFLDGISNES